ncbi:MAG TPA: 7-carboxy-7-deazaguanine synthase QueE [Geobacteraceae bacterium]
MSDPLRISEIFSSIQGEGMLAGRRQVFIRVAGCNLVCRYCDTDHRGDEPCRVETGAGTGEFTRFSQPLALDTVIGVVADWIAALPGAHHSVSLTGGEPLHCADTLGAWLPELRRYLPVHLETNGTLHSALEQVIGNIDYISMDIKLPSTAGCQEQLWEHHRLFLRAARAGNVSVKVVVGEETPPEEIRQTCDIIASVDPAIPLFLQPLTLACGSIGISGARLLALQEVASSLLPDVRVIPQMHKLLRVL